jgi:flagellar hook-length control protein FliK
MQILPSSDETRAKAGLATLGGLDPQDYRKQAEAFSSYFDACLAEATDSSGQNITTTRRKGESSADAANTATLATSGLLSAGIGNVVSDPNNVRMTKEDFAQLKASLSKSGVSAKDIEELQARIDTPQGLTWGSFMTFLQDKIVGSQPGALSAESKRQVQSFLGKIGFTPGESSELLTELEQGQTTKAWSSISSKLASLSAETTLTVTPAEAQALAQALGLSTSAQTRLSELFSRLEDSELVGRDIKTALLAITAEVKDQAASENKSLAEMKELASQVFVAAQKREFGQTLSDSREDQVARKAMLAREMASRGADESDGSTSSGTKSVADLGFAFTEEAEASAKAAKGQAQGATEGQGVGHKRVTLSEDGQGADNQGQSGATGNGKGFSGNGSASGNQNGTTDERGAKERATANREQSGLGDTKTQKDSGASSTYADWTGFWSKIGLDVGATRISGTEATLKDALAGISSSQVSPRMAQAENSQVTNSSVSSDVLRQVENGMLKNLGQGANRLTLNLTPDELGSVTVMLTVKDKDVQAVIRAETPEAAKILSENMVKVRESLEQQGLKVSKLDVQTNLAQQQDQSAWQGANQHNEARRQQEELDMRRTALRILGMGAAGSADVASDTVSSAMTTRNEGVDVFA